MRLFGAILLSFCFSTVWGQLNNRVFEDRLLIEPADSGKLFAGINALGFFKNNEYKQTIIEGYTLFGYQFQPYISFQPIKNIRIDAGIYLQQDFGNSKISTTAPVFSMKWKSKDFSVIFGTLEGSLNHRLIEPLYDFERVLNRRLETGVQFQVNREDLFVDAWFDWQYMQYLNDSKQEQFVGGLSLQKRILRLGSGFLSVPLQAVARHQGGQLDMSGLGVQTIVNTAVGLNWQQPMDGFAKEIVLNGFYVFDKDITLTRQPYLDGDGIFVNGTMSTKFGLDVMASYWQGREWLAFQGGKIYQSISSQDAQTVQPDSKLVILRFLYNYQVADNLWVSLRYEPFFDLGFDSFQYAYGFYINYRSRYFLAKPHK
ncbi:MAG: hypothetical protein JNK10_04525 [Cyclobacteriaceae bacterium]|nr:hypothetical protein [Cyclobacteriaceae bacterium]